MSHKPEGLDGCCLNQVFVLPTLTLNILVRSISINQLYAVKIITHTIITAQPDDGL
jgi:hypothetical protein